MWSWHEPFPPNSINGEAVLFLEEQLGSQEQQIQGFKQ
jgi:hypothetical protein